MAKAYSIDLRERVVAAYKNERKSIREVAKLFNVSKNLVSDGLKRVRETGSVAPKDHGVEADTIFRLKRGEKSF